MDAERKTLGKYRIVALLGRGGAGEVYKAYQDDLRRYVAIKTMQSGDFASPNAVDKFQREAQLAAGLRHPNIVEVHDTGVDGDLHYIVMEYVDGRSVEQLIKDNELDQGQALRIAFSVAHALAAAHGQGIIHGDIKPSNILIDSQGRVRILDFGTAPSLDNRSQSLNIAGTPTYMAPEQAAGDAANCDSRADIYSLGATLYEMVSGRAPFNAPTAVGLLRQIQTTDAPRSGATDQVEMVLRKAMHKEPGWRFQSARSMADALRACSSASVSSTGHAASGRTIHATRPRSTTAASHHRRAARPVMLLATALVFALAAGISAVVVWDPAADATGQLRALLADRGAEVNASELQRFRADPNLRPMIARHRLRHGQFGRALRDLEGYDGFMCRLATAPVLQRFIAPGLFLGEPKFAVVEADGDRAALVAAARLYLAGEVRQARAILPRGHGSDASSAHVMLVRSHLDLWDAWPQPTEPNAAALIAALRADLDGFDSLEFMPLRALSAHLAGDTDAAWSTADRLAEVASRSAATHVLRATLLHAEGRDEAALNALARATELDHQLHSSPLQTYLKLRLRLRDAGAEPPPDAVMRELDRAVVDGTIDGRPHPLLLLTRATALVLHEHWWDAQRDLAQLANTASTAHFGPRDDLRSLVATARQPRHRLLVAGRDLLLRLEHFDAALRTSDLIRTCEVPDPERPAVDRDNFAVLARLTPQHCTALHYLEEALALGAKPEELRVGDWRNGLPQAPGFAQLLDRR